MNDVMPPQGWRDQMNEILVVENEPKQGQS